MDLLKSLRVRKIAIPLLLNRSEAIMATSPGMSSRN
jgi:hypothetical protein